MARKVHKTKTPRRVRTVREIFADIRATAKNKRDKLWDELCEARKNR